MKKKALILGVTGQDGSYMLELLIQKKYEVHGLIRKSATGNTKNIDRSDPRFRNNDAYGFFGFQRFPYSCLGISECPI